MKFCCHNMEYYLNLEDKVIVYSSRFNEYGIPICDGGDSYIVISHCPWCGKKLPESKRNEWFDELEKLGFDEPMFNDLIPEEYKTSKWYEKNK